MPRQTFISRARVAAGILRDADGRVLIAQRTADQSFAGLWEFPGGKIRHGESSESALRRELAEELGIEIVAHSILMSLEHDYPDRTVAIDFYLIHEWANTPRGRSGQALRWVSPEALDACPMLPADGPVIEALVGSDQLK